VPCFGERRRDGTHVVGPVTRARGSRERELRLRAEIRRCRAHARVLARRRERDRGAVDRARQHEAVVVVRVLADQVHAARCASAVRRRAAETARELVGGSDPQLVLFGHFLAPRVPRP
jgi:hypothetical protein